MKLSVLIPSFCRPEAINNCLAHLSVQSCNAPFEILIGLDGSAELTPDPIVPDSVISQVRITRFPKIGYISIRRALLEQAQGEIVLLLNDDSYAAADLLESHLEIHALHGPCVVSGSSGWKRIESANFFDHFVQNSNLIFFQQVNVSHPQQTTYRNCFGLNMSFPRQLALQVGGFPEMQDCYGYDDIEIAYRLAKAGAQLWYAPNASVVHDHRFEPVDVLRREYLLGRSAWKYAQYHPEFTNELFRRDIRSAKVREYFAQSLEYEYADAVRIEKSFLALSVAKPDSVNMNDPRVELLIEEHWVLLKRYLWRWGVIDAAHGCVSRWSLVKDFSVRSNATEDVFG